MPATLELAAVDSHRWDGGDRLRWRERAKGALSVARNV